MSIVSEKWREGEFSLDEQLRFEAISPDAEEYPQMIDLRLRILRHPLGLGFTPEDLAAEREDFHIVGYLGRRLVACLLLCPQSGERLKMRQVAVEEDLQGRGMGSAMVIFSEAFAIEKGFSEMVLNARELVVPFYERLGYEVMSERFIEVTIPHFTMQKRLS